LQTSQQRLGPAQLLTGQLQNLRQEACSFLTEYQKHICPDRNLYSCPCHVGSDACLARMEDMMIDLDLC
jgi:hypothetical protein